MAQTFGIEAPRRHGGLPHQAPARYLVIIESGGCAVARFFLATFEQVAQFDASAEEVAAMIKGLSPAVGATGSEWDQALSGHSSAERGAAQVYALPI